MNPHSPCGEKDFKSFASADFATRAYSPKYIFHCSHANSIRAETFSPVNVAVPHCQNEATA